MTSPVAELLKLHRPFIVMDFETTGVDPSVARICQIAMRIHRPDGSLKVWKSLVKPGVPMPRSAEVTHGISDQTLAEGCAACHAVESEHPSEKCDRFRPVPRFDDLAANLLQGWTDVDFCGYNIRYDLRVAAEEFLRRGMEFDYSKARVFDALRIWQLLEPRTLSDAVERILDEKITDAHDAMADVIWTERVFIGQFTRHPKGHTLPRDLDELDALQWPRDPNGLDSEGKFKYDDNGDLTFTFGKFRAQRVADQMSYVRWMLGASFSPEVRRVCEGILAGVVPLRKSVSG